MFIPLFIDGLWNTTFNTELKDYCDKVRELDTGRKVSNKGGYQSNDLTLSDSQLKPLQDHILKETSRFSSTFNFIHKSFKVNNMWININGYKDYNSPHYHTGCQFSGVYYIHTPKDCGNIQFNRGHEKVMGYHWLGHFDKWNNHNSMNWYLPSEKYRCYIFPSYLEHFVEPNLNKEEERYSISFNVALSNS